MRTSGWTRISLLIPTLLTTVLVGALGGCTKSSDSPGNSSPPPAAPQSATPPNAPPVEQILTSWQQGDQATAIDRFLETDWTTRPLFAADSPLNLSEEQYKALSAAVREAKSAAKNAQTKLLKQLAGDVAQAGRDAAAKNDRARARKHFTALRQFGNALDSSDHLAIVGLVGRSIKKMADAELSKVGQ